LVPLGPRRQRLLLAAMRLQTGDLFACDRNCPPQSATVYVVFLSGSAFGRRQMASKPLK
jgi:hypothetical protein